MYVRHARRVCWRETDSALGQTTSKGIVMRDRHSVMDLQAQPRGIAMAVIEARAVRRPVVCLTPLGHPDASPYPSAHRGTRALPDRQFALFTPLLAHIS